MDMRNREAEYAIIGIAMTDMEAADKLSALPEDLFTFPATKLMHKGIRQLRADNNPVDLITLCDKIRTDDFPPETDAIEALQTGIAPAMYRSYESILLELRKRRNATSVAKKLITDMMNNDCDVHTSVEEAMAHLSTEESADINLDMKSALFQFVDGLGKNGRRVPTGIADIDAMTGGFTGGQLVIIGARPGVGKSALVINMAMNAAIKGFSGLIISREMNSDEILTRMVARISGVDSMNISRRNLQAEDFERMGQCYEEISKLRLEINTRADSPMQIRRAATAMRNHGGLDFIVVDYLGLLRSDTDTRSRYEAVSDISRALKTMAMDLDIPVIALAQLNRSSEVSEYGKVSSRMPTLADFRDSGSIEQDANICMLLWCPPDKNNDTADAWEMCKTKGCALVQVNLAKNRQGRTGVFNLAFDKSHMRFVSIRRD